MYGKNFIWNSIASIVNAAESVFMIMVVTRVTGIEDAGILTIAFAVGNLLMNIGKFGVRGFQVTDVKRIYSYSAYFFSRVITVLLMLLATIIYVVYKYYCSGDSFYKIGCIVTICLIYCVESLEDVIWGECQRNNRLDLGAKLFISRWISILLTFLIVILITNNMFCSLVVSLSISVIVFMIGYRLLIHKSEIAESFKLYRKSDNSRNDIYEILKVCSPLFAIGFLYFYINNSPKYAIDAYGFDELQAYYGFIAMPIFVIELLNGMIYQPSVVWMTEQWVDKNLDSFKNRVKRQFLIIILIGLICVVGIAIVGVPILSFIYNTDLSAYWLDMILLQIAGIVLAMAGYLTVLLTIQRQQNWMMLFYLVDTIFALAFMQKAVDYGQIRGAVLMQTLCLTILFVLKLIRFVKVVREQEQREV